MKYLESSTCTVYKKKKTDDLITAPKYFHGEKILSTKWLVNLARVYIKNISIWKLTPNSNEKQSPCFSSPVTNHQRSYQKENAEILHLLSRFSGTFLEDRFL